MQDQLQYSPLEEKERKELIDATHKLADLGLLSAPRRAAKIDELEADLHGAQDQLLERYPKQADLEQKIVDRETQAVKLAAADLAEDGNEDATLAKDVDGLQKEFKTAADRSAELARKYLTGIKTEEAAELVDVKPKRDKAFEDLMAKAAPVLQQRVADRQKAVDDLQKTLDPLKKAVADAQDRVKKAADPNAKAEEQKGLVEAKQKLADATKDLDKKLEQPKKDLLRVQNEKKEVDQAKDDSLRLTKEMASLVQSMDGARKDMTTKAQDLEKEGLCTPILVRVKKQDKEEYQPQIVDEQGDPVKPESLPAPDKNRLGEGRRVFSERGCLACHVHNGVREKGTNPGDPPPVPDAAADFAPDLSRVAAKIAPKTGDPKEDATARRLWVVQWVLNPNIYHPRTQMPITHLTVQQACDVADWLLSQEVKPEELANWKDPEDPKPRRAGGAGAAVPGQGARHDQRQGGRDPAGRRPGRESAGRRTSGRPAAGHLQPHGPRRRRVFAGGRLRRQAGAHHEEGSARQAGMVHREEGDRPARLLRLPRRAGLRDGQADRHGPQ